MFSIVNQVLFQWINSYQLFSENKIKTDILNFHDIIKILQAVTVCQTMTDRFMKFVKNSFEFSFADKKIEFSEKDISEFNEKLINEQKKKCKSIKNFNELFVE